MFERGRGPFLDKKWKMCHGAGVYIIWVLIFDLFVTFGLGAIFNFMAARWLGDHEGWSVEHKWRDKENRNLRL
jgi:hypothetical protein